ncbi:MAG TPA: hypothetical protein VEB21_04830 [Terriglobales bacterium]|nr:hypothetical protein [Terriglobales bacterium]
MNESNHAGCNPDVLGLLETFLQTRFPGNVGQIFEPRSGVHVLTQRHPARGPGPGAWTQLRLPGEVCLGASRRELIELLVDPMFVNLLDVAPVVEFYFSKRGVAAREVAAATCATNASEDENGEPGEPCSCARESAAARLI